MKKPSYADLLPALVGFFGALGFPAKAYYFGSLSQARLGLGNNCPQCQLLAMRQAQAAPLAGMGQDNVSNGMNIASIFMQAQYLSPLYGPTGELPSSTPTLVADDVNWAPGQELPGAFHRPWSWPKSDFDPTFLPSSGWSQGLSSSWFSAYWAGS